MKLTSFLSLVTTMVLLSGCSGKQYFEPQETFSASSHSYGETIIDLSRDGATLSSGRYIGKDGVNKNIEIGENYRFLSEDDSYVLSSNIDGVLNIIDKQSNESVRAVALHVPVVSASISNGLIAYILNNNTFGLYRIADNKKIFENRSERTFAIDTRAASPIFIDNLVVMPMLDGKLIIVDIHNSDNTKVVYLSSKKAFNNVIYLSRMGNTMVAATPQKIITIGSDGKKEYRANISETAVTQNNVYLFTKEGMVIKLNKSLEVITSKKFKFAHYAVATVLDDKVFALDQQGSLIVLSSDLTKHKVYALGSVDNPAYITGTKLYKDGKIIELSKLGYE
jgi:hypothetical protein